MHGGLARQGIKQNIPYQNVLHTVSRWFLRLLVVACCSSASGEESEEEEAEAATTTETETSRIAEHVSIRTKKNAENEGEDRGRVRGRASFRERR
jgi:hypothetical protein